MNSHGANVFEIAKDEGIKIEDIRDFSSNINPLGPSKRALESLKENLNLLSTYPDVDYVDLKKAISSYASCDVKNIVLGLGSTEILKDAIHYFAPKTSMILSPCYSEYERELRKISSYIIQYNLEEKNDFKVNLDELIKIINEKNVEFLIFANPNNPTGTILTRYEIERILKETNARVLVDETYIEFTDMETFSSSSLTKSYDKLIVVRGTSKFFALPGIRLGYGLTSNHELLKFFKDKEVLWQINSVAEICGKVMFSDEAYIKEVHDFVRTRRVGLYKKLAKIKNLRAFESYGNFVLVKILRGPDARKLRGRLMKKGLVVRNCDTFKNLDKSYFRFCILDDDANERLIENLREIYQEVK
ncbi:histidinol-phosphate transaminase [Peptoniphilus sp. DNF00840]|uniref:pyridoxal phosphate-dependent aminotransferase n=1 Tax=Peptoniphilus sp. DNF00840 TaxID=1477000 RepID=UPI000794DE2F|nr:histidinol-phosphate transaminase [Peptoniphilus sp. DNF00840]KXB71398.1 putative histidinol-phosphate transaminase [Peptoniphilus sp. DNF00840]